MPAAAVIGYDPTLEEAVAVVASAGAPVTPLVASASPFLNPLIVAVNDGFAVP